MLEGRQVRPQGRPRLLQRRLALGRGEQAPHRELRGADDLHTLVHQIVAQQLQCGSPGAAAAAAATATAASRAYAAAAGPPAGGGTRRLLAALRAAAAAGPGAFAGRAWELVAAAAAGLSRAEGCRGVKGDGRGVQRPCQRQQLPGQLLQACARQCSGERTVKSKRVGFHELETGGTGGQLLATARQLQYLILTASSASHSSLLSTASRHAALATSGGHTAAVPLPPSLPPDAGLNSAACCAVSTRRSAASERRRRPGAMEGARSANCGGAWAEGGQGASLEAGRELSEAGKTSKLPLRQAQHVRVKAGDALLSGSALPAPVALQE